MLFISCDFTILPWIPTTSDTRRNQVPWIATHVRAGKYSMYNSVATSQSRNWQYTDFLLYLYWSIYARAYFRYGVSKFSHVKYIFKLLLWCCERSIDGICQEEVKNTRNLIFKFYNGRTQCLTLIFLKYKCLGFI